MVPGGDQKRPAGVEEEQRTAARGPAHGDGPTGQERPAVVEGARARAPEVFARGHGGWRGPVDLPRCSPFYSAALKDLDDVAKELRARFFRQSFQLFAL